MLTAFIIICIHWIADFVFQAEKWAIGKSKDSILLFKHTLTYTAVWLVALIIWGFFQTFTFEQVYAFLLITFGTHTVTDYFTSRINSNLYKKGKFGSPIPNFGFFSMIGLDQVLHYAQLFLTYYYITK